MALARVQGTAKVVSAGSVASVAITFATPPTVGNGIIVPLIAWTAAQPFVAGDCTDNRGNVYQIAVQQFNNNQRVVLFYCERVQTSAGPFTITLTNKAAGTAFFVANAIEVSGVGFGLGVDQVVSATGSTAAPATGSTPALTAAEVIVVAAHAIGTNETSITVASVSPSWLEEYESLSTTIQAGEADSRILTSVAGTTTSASWTDTTSSAWVAALAAFHGVAVVPPARVTQDAIETVSLPVLPAMRVTQDAVELLSFPLPAARVTQTVIETLGDTVGATGTSGSGDVTLSHPLLSGAGTVSAPPVGTGTVTISHPLLAGSGTATGPLYSGAGDVTLSHPTITGAGTSALPTTARVTQRVTEVLAQSPPLQGDVTQVVAEVLASRSAGLRTTQLVLEYFTPPVVAARSTQIVVEVFRSCFPCITGDFLLDTIAPGSTCSMSLPVDED